MIVINIVKYGYHVFKVVKVGIMSISVISLLWPWKKGKINIQLVNFGQLLFSFNLDHKDRMFVTVNWTHLAVIAFNPRKQLNWERSTNEKCLITFSHPDSALQRENWEIWVRSFTYILYIELITKSKKNTFCVWRVIFYMK